MVQWRYKKKNNFLISSFVWSYECTYIMTSNYCRKNNFHYRYDHLSRILTKILDERPENVCDIFEDISRDTKKCKFTSSVDTVQDRIDQSTEVALAQIQRKLFAVSINYFLILEGLTLKHMLGKIQQMTF